MLVSVQTARHTRNTAGRWPSRFRSGDDRRSESERDGSGFGREAGFVIKRQRARVQLHPGCTYALPRRVRKTTALTGDLGRPGVKSSLSMFTADRSPADWADPAPFEDQDNPAWAGRKIRKVPTNKAWLVERPMPPLAQWAVIPRITTGGADRRPVVAITRINGLFASASDTVNEASCRPMPNVDQVCPSLLVSTV